MADHEVAHGHARKARRLEPVVAVDGPSQHLDAEAGEVEREEHVEQKELGEGVGGVEELDEEIHESVAEVEAAASEAAADGAFEVSLEVDISLQ